MHVRIIGSGGEKHVSSPDVRSETWADSGAFTGTRLNRAGPWRNPQPVSEAPWLEPRNFGTWTVWQPAVWYSADLGAVVGASVTHTTYGFRAAPAAKEQTLRGGWAFGQSSGKIEYDGTFRRPAAALGFDLRTALSGVEQVNFFGFGNDTPTDSRSRYHIQQTLLTLAPAVRIGSAARASLAIGPELRYSDSGKRQGTILSEQAPYGIGRFGVVDLRATFEAGTRKDASPALMAVALGEATGEHQMRRPAAASECLPRCSWRLQRSTSPIHMAASRATSWDTPATGACSSRSGSAASAFQEPIRGSMGRSSAARTIAAFARHRFGGDASAYGNAELRAYVGPPVFGSIFPVRLVWLASPTADACGMPATARMPGTRRPAAGCC